MVPDIVDTQVTGLEAGHVLMVEFIGVNDVNSIRTIDKLLPMLKAAEGSIRQN